MSETKGNGHDPATTEMVRLLGQIAEEVRGLRVETSELRAEVNAQLGALRRVTDTAHIRIHERVDEAHQEAVANTERLTELPDGLIARVERLEAAVFKKPRPARRRRARKAA